MQLRRCHRQCRKALVVAERGERDGRLGASRSPSLCAACVPGWHRGRWPASTAGAEPASQLPGGPSAGRWGFSPTRQLPPKDLLLQPDSIGQRPRWPTGAGYIGPSWSGRSSPGRRACAAERGPAPSSSASCPGPAGSRRGRLGPLPKRAPFPGSRRTPASSGSGSGGAGPEKVRILACAVLGDSGDRVDRRGLWGGRHDWPRGSHSVGCRPARH